MEDPEGLERYFRVAREFVPLSAQEMAAIEAKAQV
jgi:hypothetical protein